MKGLIFLLVLLFIGGGFAAVGEALGVLGQVMVGFFPIFYEVGKMAVEDYLTSPYVRNKRFKFSIYSLVLCLKFSI